jgi:hypothetical protein
MEERPDDEAAKCLVNDSEQLHSNMKRHCDEFSKHAKFVTGYDWKPKSFSNPKHKTFSSEV